MTEQDDEGTAAAPSRQRKIKHSYIERDYISSYTPSMSVAEKFSQNVKKDKVGISALISADCDYFRGRIGSIEGRPVEL